MFQRVLLISWDEPKVIIEKLSLDELADSISSACRLAADLLFIERLMDLHPDTGNNVLYVSWQTKDEKSLNEADLKAAVARHINDMLDLYYPTGHPTMDPGGLTVRSMFSKEATRFRVPREHQLV